MKNNLYPITGITTALMAIGACSPTVESLENSRPNIVFIMIDDLGWADLPVYGNRFNEAPRITRMAEEGIRFTRAYAAPVCSPTRASIQSGQYSARVGVIDFIPGHWRPYEEVIVPQNRNQHLPLNITTIGETMREAGYRTAYIGKWHLGRESEHHPGNRGYEHAFEYMGGGFFNPRFDPPYDDFAPGQVLSDIMTDMSIDYIRSVKNEPFFLFLSHYDVHIPLDADMELINKYLGKELVSGYPCNAVYAAMIEHVDNSVGRMLDALDEMDLAGNTLVVFYSDNGGLVSNASMRPVLSASKRHIYESDPRMVICTSNDPLRNEKGSLYEGGIRVPMIVRWKGTIPSGIVSPAPVNSPDFYPTFTALAGGTLPSGQVIDGKSLIPELTGENPEPERTLFWHYPVYHHDVPASAIIKGEWKLIEKLADNSLELYHIGDDISESNNLAGTNPGKLQELKNELDKWREETGAEMPVRNPNFDPERRHLWGTHPSRR